MWTETATHRKPPETQVEHDQRVQRDASVILMERHARLIEAIEDACREQWKAMQAARLDAEIAHITSHYGEIEGHRRVAQQARHSLRALLALRRQAVRP